jgi:hypothetical protein
MADRQSNSSSLMLSVVCVSIFAFLSCLSSFQPMAHFSPAYIYASVSSVSSHVVPQFYQTKEHETYRFFEEHYGYLRPSPSQNSEKHPNCTRNSSGNWEFFELDESQRSRLNEDKVIYEWFFKDRLEKGTYLELGAFNGERESNTRFFDECLGWEGLLVEPNPKMKDELIKSRPQAHRMFFAPSCQSTNETVSFISSEYTSSRQKHEGESVETNNGVTKLPCGPFSPVLETVMNSHIRFVSLDVEGAEAMVVRTINWTNFRVDVMIVESVNALCKTECEHRTEVRAIMKEAGYLLFTQGVSRSDLFVHPSVVERPPPPFHRDV